MVSNDTPCFECDLLRKIERGRERERMRKREIKERERDRDKREREVYFFSEPLWVQ